MLVCKLFILQFIATTIMINACQKNQTDSIKFLKLLILTKESLLAKLNHLQAKWPMEPALTVSPVSVDCAKQVKDFDSPWTGH